MTPHDFRRIALAHELLAPACETDRTPQEGRPSPVRDGAPHREDDTPAIPPAREDAG